MSEAHCARLKAQHSQEVRCKGFSPQGLSFRVNIQPESHILAFICRLVILSVLIDLIGDGQSYTWEKLCKVSCPS